MDEPRSVKFLGLLRTLLRHGVDFFVVGGVAAQLEGAPILTFDLDILYDKTPQNLDRAPRRAPRAQGPLPIPQAATSSRTRRGSPPYGCISC
jgi:hypothetical protein